MRWPIRYQIFFPFAAVLMAAVVVTSTAAALLAARRGGTQHAQQLREVIAAIGDGSFPYNEAVLERMRGLSGAHFELVDGGGAPLATTLPIGVKRSENPATVPSTESLDHLSDLPVVEIESRRYFVARVRVADSARAKTLYVYYPEESWQQARWDAAWPPLAVGCGVVPVVLLISGVVAHRIGTRIQSVQRLFSSVVEGRFEHAPANRPFDEIYDLVRSANDLSDQLSAMREQIASTERLRLLGQLAGGFAHQLRNAITGARMAIQLHQRRCRIADDDSLQVALAQLTLTEEQVKAILSLGRRSQSVTENRRDLRAILSDVELLVTPACRHFHVAMHTEYDPSIDTFIANDSDALKAALLNLVLNAIDAAGVNGETWIRSRMDGSRVRIDIEDSGKGPPPELEGRLFDPFVTSKPEGVGLGLVLAKQAAVDAGGELIWTRINDRTAFTMWLPAQMERANIVPESRNG